MSRLDDLLQNSSEDFRTLTVRVAETVAEDLKVKAKKLGVSRTKLVNELFFSGYDEFNKKYSGSNGSSVTADE